VAQAGWGFQLPVFERVAPYRSSDGQVEVDVLVEGSQCWVIEIKWRNKLAGVKEMQKLLHNARVLDGHAWYISQAGFTSEAITFAQENLILYSHRRHIEELAKDL
jgi:hypothetical protein